MFPNPPLHEIQADHLLTVDQAAERFGVTPQAIRQWVFRQKITHVDLGDNGPKLYHIRPLAQAEREAYNNGASRPLRGGRKRDYTPIAA